MRLIRLAALALALMISGSTWATASTRCASCARSKSGRIKRSATAKRQFAKSKPCPSTGKKTAGCPGYVIDHVKPLACGGVDEAGNMAWQTATDGKAKDRVKRKGCR